MPKPHFPSHGGPHLPAYTGPTAQTHRSANRDKAIPAPDPRQQRELQAEVERLRMELEVARQPRRWFASHTGTANQTMVWAALALCGFVMLFALYAILNHG